LPFSFQFHLRICYFRALTIKSYQKISSRSFKHYSNINATTSIWRKLFYILVFYCIYNLFLLYILIKLLLILRFYSTILLNKDKYCDWFVA